MVGDTVLGEVIGADLAGPVAGAYLAFPLGGNGGVLLLLLGLVQLGAENFHGPVLVFILAALVLALHHRAGGQVGDADGGLSLVDVLSACAGGAEGVDLQVLGVDGELHLLRLGHHGHGGGGGLDAAGGLRFRHPLDPVGPGLEFQAGPGPLALDGDAGFLDAAQLRGVFIHQLHVPAPALGIQGVHPQQVRREQGALLAADAGPDLQDDVPVVVGVPGQQQAFKLLRQAVPLLACPVQLLLGQLPHFRVRQQLLGPGTVRLRLLPGPEGGHDGGQLLLLPAQAGQGLSVGVHRRVRQLPLHLVQPPGDGL